MRRANVLKNTVHNGNSYSFNAQNELMGGNGVTVKLIHDGLGRVLKRTINGIATIFVYDGWKVMEELDSSGNLVAWNIYGAGPDEILWRNQNGTTLIYHTDKEGNVTYLLNSGGFGIEHYTYDAFGAAKIMDWNGNVRSVSAYGNRFMFNGKDYVAEIGLYDYRHRWYQPQLGRFLQVDPKGFDAGDENLFRYCLDDPIDKTDPEGLAGLGEAPRYPDISAADRMDVINLAGETSLQGNLAASALSAYNNSLGGGSNIIVAQVSPVDSAGDERRHYSSESAARTALAGEAYRHQEADEPRREYSGYVSENNKNSRDFITSAPLRGDLGTVKKDRYNHEGYKNYSSIPVKDPSPVGYHRVAVVYTHLNWRTNIDIEDRRAYFDLRVNVTLATRPQPGGNVYGPNIINWDWTTGVH